MIKKLLYIIPILLLLAMSPGGRGGADHVDFPNIYIDGTTGGVGSEADPLSAFSDINWTTGGDNSVYDAVAAGKDVTINLKRGVTWTERMTVGCSGSAAHPITIQAYGSGADPIVNAAGAVPGWETSGNWTTSYGADLVTDGGFAAVEVTGAELVPNGTMEADSNWNDFLAPDTNERSAEQTHGGSYSRKMTAAGSGTGIKSDSYSTTTGKFYRFQFWAYPPATQVAYNIWRGDGTAVITGLVISGLTGSNWNECNRYYLDKGGGASAAIAMAAKYSGTWYFDDASVKECVFTSWTQGVGWTPADDGSGVLTNKAKKTAGTASNLEQSGLAAEASAVYKIVWTVADRTAGAVQVEFGSTNGASQNTNDTFTEYITASDTDNLKIKADSSFDGTIDSIAVYKQGTVWYIQDISIDPYRIWIDDTEYMQAITDDTHIDATHRWWWDDLNGYLYVYSIAGNPADELTTLVASYYNTGHSVAIRITDFSYITVKDLDLRGGYYAAYVHADAATVTSIIFDGCTIGKNSGVHALQSASFHDDYDVTYGEVKNCTFDSNCSLNYDFNAANEGIERPANLMNLNNGSQYWKIHDNTFQDNLHSAILIEATETGRHVIYNEVYDNTFTFSNVNLGRALAVTSQSGCTCSYNKFYRNYIQDSAYFNNFGGTHNEFTYNIINTVTNPSYIVTGVAYGIIIRPVDDTSSNHKICNNVFYNCEEPGIAVSDAGTSTPVAVLIHLMMFS